MGRQEICWSEVRTVVLFSQLTNRSIKLNIIDVFKLAHCGDSLASLSGVIYLVIHQTTRHQMSLTDITVGLGSNLSLKLRYRSYKT